MDRLTAVWIRFLFWPHPKRLLHRQRGYKNRAVNSTGRLKQLLLALVFTGFVQTVHAQLIVDDLNGGQLTPEDLVDELLGTNNTAIVSNISITGDPRCLGRFIGGNGLGGGALGFDSGTIISSGRVVDTVGPNISDETTSEFFRPGDSFLNSLVPGEQTFDACVIEFDFECPAAETVSVDYVFGSEEYNEFVGDGANDVFGFALNGQNISLIPNSGGLPVTIGNLNCGNPFDPFAPTSPNAPFCDLFINNDLQDGGGAINIEADGLTTMLQAQGDLLPGINHMKFAVADVLDEAFDSWVYLRSGSFQCELPQAPAPDPKLLVSTSNKAFQYYEFFANEDVLQFDEETNLFEKFFDGSDVGLVYDNVDALTQTNSGDLLISLDDEAYIYGVGFVRDEDILRFIPTTLGDQTEGVFELFFDGSQNGLGGYGVNIDGLDIDEGVATGVDDDNDGLPNELDLCPLDAQNDIDMDGICGNVLIYFSLSASAYIGGSWFADEDIIVFTEETGTFAKYFNGSRVGLTYTNLNALELQSDGSILMSFDYPVYLSGLGAIKPDDIVRFIPTSLGYDTAGSFELFLDGSTTNLKGYYLDFDAIGQNAQ